MSIIFSDSSEKTVKIIIHRNLYMCYVFRFFTKNDTLAIFIWWDIYNKHKEVEPLIISKTSKLCEIKETLI